MPPWADLSADELAVLVGLVRLVLHADDEISPAEQDTLSELQSSFGVDRWNDAVLTAYTRFPSEEALLYSASQMRAEKRWPLLAALTDLAGSDGIEATEASWLGRILRSWGDERVAPVAPQP